MSCFFPSLWECLHYDHIFLLFHISVPPPELLKYCLFLFSLEKKDDLSFIMIFQVCVTFSNVACMYKIISITERGASRLTFPCKDEKTGVTKNITVMDYFKHVHGKSLYFPNFNCVQVAPSEKNIFLPMEVWLIWVQ